MSNPSFTQFQIKELKQNLEKVKYPYFFQFYKNEQCIRVSLKGFYLYWRRMPCSPKHILKHQVELLNAILNFIQLKIFLHCIKTLHKKFFLIVQFLFNSGY